MPNNESTLELQLPPKQYCRWKDRFGSDVSLIMAPAGDRVRPALVIGKYIHTRTFIEDPRIVYSVGAIAWRREVKRLMAEWLKIPAPRTPLANKLMFAQAQEAAWRERAAGSEKGAAK